MPPDFLETRFQLLPCRIVIQYQDPVLRDQLDYIAVSARQSVSVTSTYTYRVSGSGPYVLHEDGDFLADAALPEDVSFYIYRRVYRRMLERFVLAGWVVFHAGLVKINNKSFLLMGNKGAGKTTLVTRLLLAGYALEGDEMVLARGNEIMAVPRRLHLKPGIEEQVPELASHLDGLPVALAGDLKIRGLDPANLGFDWRIAPCQPDHLVWLSPNHGGVTELQALGSFSMMQKLLEAYLGWGESKSRVVSCAANLSRGGGHRLVLGEASDAVSHLEQLAASKHSIDRP